MNNFVIFISVSHFSLTNGDYVYVEWLMEYVRFSPAHQPRAAYTHSRARSHIQRAAVLMQIVRINSDKGEESEWKEIYKRGRLLDSKQRVESRRMTLLG